MELFVLLPQSIFWLNWIKARVFIFGKERVASMGFCTQSSGDSHYVISFFDSVVVLNFETKTHITE